MLRSTHTTGLLSSQLVPATGPLTTLHDDGTGRRDLSHKQLSHEAFWGEVAENCPKNTNQFECVGLLAGTKF